MHCIRNVQPATHMLMSFRCKVSQLNSCPTMSGLLGSENNDVISAMLLQARSEASEAEVQHLQQRLLAAANDRTAELEHVQQLNRSLKVEIAALQNRLSGFADSDFASQHSDTAPGSGNTSSQVLESFGSCLLVDPASGSGQSLPQLTVNSGIPYVATHRLAPIPEGDGSVSAHTSMQGDEVLQDVHLVPELQSQVRALAASLHDKTQEAEALHQAVERFRNEVGDASLHTTICAHAHSGPHGLVLDLVLPSRQTTMSGSLITCICQF